MGLHDTTNASIAIMSFLMQHASHMCVHNLAIMNQLQCGGLVAYQASGCHAARRFRKEWGS